MIRAWCSVVYLCLAMLGMSFNWLDIRPSRDVSEDPNLSYLFENQYVLRQGIVVWLTEDTKKLVALIPGEGSGVPVSIDDYLNYPNSWWKSPAYLKRWSDTYSSILTIVGVIEPGSKLELRRVVQDSDSFSGYFLRLYGTFDSVPWSGRELDVGDLFNCCDGYDARPQPNPDLLVLKDRSSETAAD